MGREHAICCGEHMEEIDRGVSVANFDWGYYQIYSMVYLCLKCETRKARPYRYVKFMKG